MAQVRAHNINVNHVAISVPDATLAADWYVEHLGFYRVIADDTVTRDNARSGDADQIGFKIYGTDLNKFKIAYLVSGNGIGFEIFEFQDPPYQGPGQPTRFGAGHWVHGGGLFHIAFTVPDPDEVCARIVAAGGRQVGETVRTPTKEKALYVMDPWGTVLEFCSLNFESFMLQERKP